MVVVLFVVVDLSRRLISLDIIKKKLFHLHRLECSSRILMIPVVVVDVRHLIVRLMMDEYHIDPELDASSLASDWALG